ncbi:Predicted arabinose efflux permease, MFS family [Sphingopyxis flava]|uniref:Predicted arabinose efflux permease, MFS family n=1 Tax=Sphingopyxis flava TaxID=1507287 RepID=A0A1T5FTY0_9SPHN|nr:Predicted arabinose efflux permease, MFS family [Sphingopyxis flava]
MAKMDGNQGADSVAREWGNLGLAAKAALALTSTYIALGLFTVGAALPTLQASFAQSPQAGLLIQLIGSIAAPVFAIASPVAGLLVARYGVRTVYLGSLIAFLAVGVAPAAAHSPLLILALRVLMGVAMAGAFTAGMAGIAQLPERQRHAMLGLSAFLGGAIAMFAYQAVGILAAESWRLAFLVGLVLAPAGVLALSLPGNGNAGQASPDEPDRPRATTRVPMALLIIAIVIGWTMVAGSIYSPFYLTSIGITDPAKIGLLLAGLALGSLAGSGTYGFFQRRLGTSGTTTAGMLLCVTGCATLALGSGEAPVAIGLGLVGMGLGAAGTAIYALALEAIGPGGNSGTATGMISLALYLPQILFPVAAGVLAASFGQAVVYAAMAVLLVAGVSLLLGWARQARFRAAG